MSESFTVFVDRSFGRHDVANALRRAGIQTEIHDDHFEMNAPDEEWLTEIGKRGWVGLTKDARIGQNTLQRLWVTRYCVKLFVFMSGNMTGPRMGEAIAESVSRMKRISVANEAPFIAKIYASGDARLWRNNEALTDELRFFS